MQTLSKSIFRPIFWHKMICEFLQKDERYYTKKTRSQNGVQEGPFLDKNKDKK